MSGFVRNLFGTYFIYDSPDYEDLVPKFLSVEKYAIYFSGAAAVLDIYTLGKKKPKGALETTQRIMKFVGPAVVGSATFVGTLVASAELRGKKDDEWNSLFATLSSGVIVAKMVPGPWTFIHYSVIVGFLTNLYKQSKLFGLKVMNDESQMKRRKDTFLHGPFLTDWVFYKPEKFPQRWVNGDESDAEGRVLN